MSVSRKREKSEVPTATDFLIASRQCELRHLEYFLQMGKLVQGIGDLVHGLQRERGASNVFLGSDGTRFAVERDAMKRAVDEHKVEFTQALADIRDDLTSHPVSSPLLNHIASALHGMAGLEALREAVANQRITAVDATAAFNDLIHQLITAVFEAADTVADPSIAGLLVAMVHLMNGKEYCGQERAAGSAGFSSGHFDTALSRRMMHLVEAQERCFEVFLAFANDDSVAGWQKLRAHPRETQIEQLRQLASPVGRYKQLDPSLADQWFALLTERMDELKQIEDLVEQAFHARCVERYAEARHALAHQESLIDSLAQPRSGSPRLVLCDSGEVSYPNTGWEVDDIGQQSGRSVFDLLQEQTHRLQQMSDELSSAKEALEDRKTQEKAVLILMKHRGIDNDEAHRLLRKLAMDQGKRLPDVARALVALSGVLEG